MKKLKTVKEYIKEKIPHYEWGITTYFSSPQELKESYPFNQKEFKDAYKRTSFMASLYCAQKHAKRLGAYKLGFSGRFFNSGMAAIATLLKTVLKRGDLVIASEVLYTHSKKLLEHLLGYGIQVEFIDPASSEFRKILKSLKFKSDWKEYLFSLPKVRMIFLETVGNGLKMPTCGEDLLKEILEAIQGTDILLVLDNTFLTPVLFNPFKILEEKLKGINFVYVESLSKYYRASLEDDYTAGLIVAPHDLIPELDETTAELGTYLQPSTLMLMPYDLLKAAKRVIKPIFKRTQILQEILRDFPEKVELPWYNSHFPSLAKSSGVFYGVLKGGNQALKRFIMHLQIPCAGSFGHPVTTILPLGLLSSEHKPGEFRIAVGFAEDEEELFYKFWEALKKI